VTKPYPVRWDPTSRPPLVILEDRGLPFFFSRIVRLSELRDSDTKDYLSQNGYGRARRAFTCVVGGRAREGETRYLFRSDILEGLLNQGGSVSKNEAATGPTVRVRGDIILPPPTPLVEKVLKDERIAFHYSIRTGVRSVLRLQVASRPPWPCPTPGTTSLSPKPRKLTKQLTTHPIGVIA
jgi:hypothetical protein